MIVMTPQEWQYVSCISAASDLERLVRSGLTNVCAKETILEQLDMLQKQTERLRKKLGYPGIAKKVYSFPAFSLDVTKENGLTVIDREETEKLLCRWRRTFLERPGSGSSLRFELAEAVSLLLEQESVALQQAVG